jgi:predicted O-methyltransferase YrrM
MYSIEHAKTVDGWMTPQELEYLAHLSSGASVIVEIGSYKGRSACAMAANTTGILVCVDKWDDQVARAEFAKQTGRYGNVLPMPMYSQDAARLFYELGVKFDVVFIDGAHNAADVEQDIKAWSRVLRQPSSVLCGHDYSTRHHLGVKQAVDLLVRKFKVVGTIWTTESQ